MTPSGLVQAIVERARARRLQQTQNVTMNIAERQGRTIDP